MFCMTDRTHIVFIRRNVRHYLFVLVCNYHGSIYAVDCKELGMWRGPVATLHRILTPKESASVTVRGGVVQKSNCFDLAIHDFFAF